MRAHLTEVGVRALKARDKQYKVWDSSTRGFGVLVGGQAKSWIVMYGQNRRLKVLGRYPVLPLAEARKAAKKVLLDSSDLAPIVERLLNHVRGELSPIALTYNRFNYMPAMRAAVEKWEAYLTTLLSHSEDALRRAS